MEYECAWCRKKYIVEDSAEYMARYAGITHGICKDCESNIWFQLGASVQEYIDNLKAPICIVDSDVNVLAVNKSLHEVLGKEIIQNYKYKGGDVFECAYARLPEGCGNTIHCSGCTIRRTVTETFNTGKSLINIPAALRKGTTEQDMAPISMIISTERVGHVIYLRIDEMNTAKRDSLGDLQ